MPAMNTLWSDWDGPVLNLSVALKDNTHGGSIDYRVSTLAGTKRAGATFRWTAERDITDLGQVMKGTTEAWQYGAISDVGPEFDRLANFWLPRTGKAIRHLRILD